MKGGKSSQTRRQSAHTKRAANLFKVMVCLLVKMDEIKPLGVYFPPPPFCNEHQKGMKQDKAGQSIRL